ANDMMLWMMETKNELLAVVNYSTELFDAETMQRFLAAFGALLGAIVENPNQSIADLRLGSAAEQAKSRDQGAPAGTSGPSIVQRVRGVAVEHGAKIAVRSGATTLSYEELARRASGV